MGKDFFDRLDEYMAHSGLNDNKLTVAASLSIGALGKQRKGSRGLSSDSIAKILYAYPDLNGDWLLTGRGQMQYKEEAAAPMGAPPPDPVDVSGRDPNDIKLIAAYEKTIAAHEKTIAAQERDISHLEKDVEHLEGRIVDKENQLKDCEKSAADDAVTIASLTQRLAKYENTTDDGATNTETSGSEALGDAHCLGDAECFAVGKQSI